MRTVCLTIGLLFLPALCIAQDAPKSSTSSNQPVVASTQTQNTDDVVVFSGTATTAKIADADQPVVVSGRVMRMADFVAAFSASTSAAQRLHTQETHNHETNQQAPQSQPPN